MPVANTNTEASRRERHAIISRSLEKAISQLHHPYSSSHNDRLRLVINKCVSFPKNNNSNTTSTSGKGNNGKPHDAETRIALTLYHQWKRDAIVGEKSINNNTSQQQTIPTNNAANCDDGTSTTTCSTQQPPSSSVVTITSDLGLSREVSSPRQLANLIVPLLEEDFRNNPQWNMAPDVRSQASGVVSMISLERSEMLRLAGRLPCPHCIQWCKGEKGLWWHQQQYHKVEYSSATVVAQATSINSGAMIVYKEPDSTLKTTDASFGDNTTVTAEGTTTTRSLETACNQSDENTMQSDENDNPIEYVLQGNLNGLKGAIEIHGYEPSTVFDAKGATPLMWAAGGGHLEITRYLIEDCHCDPCQSQRGKRSFAGRTALHWAARNGHVEVVRYLLGLATTTTSATSPSDDCSGSTTTSTSTSTSNCGAKTNARVTTLQPIPIHTLLEAKTQDGTTAFGWACWQRHLQVMECLYRHGCDIHVLNSYGCSPVLWCSQGTNGNGLEALKWLRDRGCNTTLVNHNGHGVLHKAAQRGQRDVAEWLIREECGDSLVTTVVPTAGIHKTDSSSLGSSTSTTQRKNVLLALVGPDIEGYCPSDLAGMEGHNDFAEYLATIEFRVCQNLNCIPAYEIPAGYCNASFKSSSNASSSYLWEQYGGLRRMKAAVIRSDL